MKQIYIILLLLLSIQVEAKMLISPVDAMKSSFGKDTKVTKKNTMLTGAQAKVVSKDARVKL